MVLTQERDIQTSETVAPIPPTHLDGSVSAALARRHLDLLSKDHQCQLPNTHVEGVQRCASYFYAFTEGVDHHMYGLVLRGSTASATSLSLRLNEATTYFIDGKAIKPGRAKAELKPLMENRVPNAVVEVTHEKDTVVSLNILSQ